MKRAFFRIILACFAGGIALSIYALFIEPKRLVLRDVDLRTERYAGPVLRVGVMSDIHIGGMHVPAKRVATLVDRMNAASPDIVLLTGDFIDGHTVRAERDAEFNLAIAAGLSHLANLGSPTFASLGNHDSLYDKAEVARQLRMAGITVLDNATAMHGNICLVGLADSMSDQPDRRAYDGCDEGARPVILTHSPDAWPAFRSDAIFAVAGHTHGGQINLPIIGRRVNAVSLGPEHSYGWSKLAGLDTFVTAGIGTSILPIRFRAPPEIVVITLRPAR